MSDTEKGILLALLFLLWHRNSSVSVSIPGANKECVFPDGTIVEVPFNFACPYSGDKGQSVERILK